jgi:ATP-binding cassette subfamily F protein uup
VRQTPPAKKTASGDKAPSRAPKTGKRRLSFNEKHALDTLPGRITALTAEIATLQRQLDDPDLYARDPKAFARASAAVTEAQTALDAAEQNWLELEILREEIEGA